MSWGRRITQAHSQLLRSQPTQILYSLFVFVCFHFSFVFFVQLASGNGLETMRVWNVEHELCVNDVPLLGLESLEPHLVTHATSISSNGADMAWVGCADGAVRCYDLRLAPLQR